MYSMWHAYPGLEARLRELAGLVDGMAGAARSRYPGAGLDIAALPEVAVSGGLEGSGSQVAFPLEGPVLDILGAKAREHRCWIVVPLYLADDAAAGRYSNAAALLTGAHGGRITARSGVGSRRARRGSRVTPTRLFPPSRPTGTVGIQIATRRAFDDG
jgi:hypothetical protein